MYIYDNDFIRFKYEGTEYVCHILQDKFPESPRENDEYSAKIFFWSDWYNLGDKHDYKDSDEFLRAMIQKYVPMDTVFTQIQKNSTNLRLETGVDGVELRSNYMINGKQYSCRILKGITTSEVLSEKNYDEIMDSMETGLVNILIDSDDIVLQPLYLHDHSSISISTAHTLGKHHEAWDLGIAGWIMLDKRTVTEFWGCSESDWKERAQEGIDAVVKLYNEYLHGEVYGFTLYEKATEGTGYVKCDTSCWGGLWRRSRREWHDRMYSRSAESP